MKMIKNSVYIGSAFRKNLEAFHASTTPDFGNWIFSSNFFTLIPLGGGYINFSLGENSDGGSAW